MWLIANLKLSQEEEILIELAFCYATNNFGIENLSK